MGIASEAVREDEHGVVGAHVAVHGDAIEAVGHRFLKRGLERFRFNRRIRGDEAKHGGVQPGGRGGGSRAGRRHAGLNHPGAFAGAANADGLSTQLELDGDLLRPGVAGHDGLGGLGGVDGVVAQELRGVEDARLHVGHRHGHADAARAADEDVFDRHVQLSRGDGRHFDRVLHPLPAGTGVGVAGVDDDGLGHAPLHAWHADFHRRGANLIGGEKSGGCRGHFGDDQREIALPAFVGTSAGAEPFDVTKHSAGEKAFRRDDGALQLGKLCFHHVCRVRSETTKYSRCNAADDAQC